MEDTKRRCRGKCVFVAVVVQQSHCRTCPQQPKEHPRVDGLTLSYLPSTQCLVLQVLGNGEACQTTYRLASPSCHDQPINSCVIVTIAFNVHLSCSNLSGLVNAHAGWGRRLAVTGSSARSGAKYDVFMSMTRLPSCRTHPSTSRVRHMNHPSGITV